MFTGVTLASIITDAMTIVTEFQELVLILLAFSAAGTLWAMFRRSAKSV